MLSSVFFNSPETNSPGRKFVGNGLTWPTAKSSEAATRATRSWLRSKRVRPLLMRASTLLAPVGYVLQDVVADAMTVEAVPRREADGSEIDPEARRAMHTTMQTLGRVAIIGGLTLVALVNVFLMAGVHQLPEPQKVAAYLRVYEWALVIPVVSVSGVLLAAWIRRRNPLQYRLEVAPPPANSSFTSAR